jgi:succinate dehydrogenase / fumarate reductase cytochrome b subunit
MSTAGLKANRPLSPHLQIYRFTMTMAMSIVHRIVGVGLYFGMLLLAWWLAAAASGPAYFDFVNRIFGSWIGLVILFGFSWALIHHMLGGLRHFVWDTGHGLGKPARDYLATATLVGSVTITILLWIVGFMVRG